MNSFFQDYRIKFYKHFSCLKSQPFHLIWFDYRNHMNFLVTLVFLIHLLSATNKNTALVATDNCEQLHVLHVCAHCTVVQSRTCFRQIQRFTKRKRKSSYWNWTSGHTAYKIVPCAKAVWSILPVKYCRPSSASLHSQMFRAYLKT